MCPSPMEKMRRLRLIIGLTSLLSLFCLSSCVPVASTPLKKFSLAMQEDPLSLDPRRVRLVSNITLVKHLFEGLMKEGVSGDLPEPGLIESYSVSNDWKTYVFKLKKSFWSNGDPVTSFDFRESWLQLLSNDFPTIFGYVFDGIKGAKDARNGRAPLENVAVFSPDAMTLIVELEHPLPYFLDLLTLPAFAPVHKSTRQNYEEGRHDHPKIFNGAFFLNDWKPGVALKLKKNPRYYDNDKVNIREINIKIIPDQLTTHLLFEKGQLDVQGPPWGSNIPYEVMERLNKKGVVHSFDIAGTFWLSINTHKKPFNNEKLRRALALSIDREAIVKYILKENQKPACSILPEFRQITVTNDFNLRISEARKLVNEALEELSMTKEDFALCPLIYSSSSPRNILIAQTLREQWKQALGIILPLEGLDHKILNERRIRGHYYISTADWIADFADPMSFLSVFEQDGGLPAYSLKNPEFSRLLNVIARETNTTLRRELIQKAEHLLGDELKVIPIYHHSFACALNKAVSNVRFSRLGTMDLKYADFKTD